MSSLKIGQSRSKTDKLCFIQSGLKQINNLLWNLNRQVMPLLSPLAPSVIIILNKGYSLIPLVRMFIDIPIMMSHQLGKPKGRLTVFKLDVAFLNTEKKPLIPQEECDEIQAAEGEETLDAGKSKPVQHLTGISQVTFCPKSGRYLLPNTWNIAFLVCSLSLSSSSHQAQLSPA